MCNQMEETNGQLMYDWKHLSKKLANRNHSLWIKWQNVKTPKPHPLFRVIAGETQKWKKDIATYNFDSLDEAVNASEKNSSSGRPRKLIKSLRAASTITGAPQAYT